MTGLIDRLLRQAAEAGIDLRRFRSTLRSIPWFVGTMYDYRRSAVNDRFPLRLGRLSPMLGDRNSGAGALDGHYFHQDLWAARKIHAVRPKQHVDCGSRIDGFVAHLLTFMPVTVIDVRPLSQTVAGLTFVQADASDLAPFADDSIESLSSLHAVEHFGLGRYGDVVAPDAWRQALLSFARVLRPRGRLYLSAPIGSERVEFNAHRVFAPNTLLETLAELRLVSFAAVADDGSFVGEAEPGDFEHAHYACGLFELTK